MSNTVSMNNNVKPHWYMYYKREGSPEVAIERISASCLGDATTTAKSLAYQCKFEIVGVAPDLGLESHPCRVIAPVSDLEYLT